jgi:hypothetical protein
MASSLTDQPAQIADSFDQHGTWLDFGTDADKALDVGFGNGHL